jgi:hypothetical protein
MVAVTESAPRSRLAVTDLDAGMQFRDEVAPLSEEIE